MLQTSQKLSWNSVVQVTSLRSLPDSCLSSHYITVYSQLWSYQYGWMHPQFTVNPSVSAHSFGRMHPPREHTLVDLHCWRTPCCMSKTMQWPAQSPILNFLNIPTCSTHLVSKSSRECCNPFSRIEVVGVCNVPENWSCSRECVAFFSLHAT